MGTFELFLIAVGLSMDAFAVAVCQGLSMKRAGFKKALVVGLYFGLFQAAMPVAGYLVGSQFADMIESFDHWIAYVTLAFIGAKMIIGSLKNERSPETSSDNKSPNRERNTTDESSLSLRKMLPLAIATSIDALAVGVSFAFLQVEILFVASYIGITTLTLSMIGVKIGNIFGTKFKSKAEFAGGVILILMGFKILLEHLNVLKF